MPRRRKSLDEWWRDRFNTLAGLNPPPKDVYNYVVSILSSSLVEKKIYSKGPWTAVKLAIIAYYQDIYTVIAKEHFSNICYFDTFAGSGLVKIKGYNRFLYGSPILAILATRVTKKFDKYFFIELDENRMKILKASIKYLSDQGLVNWNDVVFIHADMNNVDYAFLINNNCDHALVFVDPESTEPYWDTIERILKLPVDFVMNFMTAGIRRAWGTFKKNPRKTEALNKFYGDDRWVSASDEYDLLEMYLEKIRHLRSKILTIEVKGIKAFHYHIIFAFRRTRGDNPWIGAVARLKEKVEKTKYSTLKNLLDTFYGKSKTILDYC